MTFTVDVGQLVNATALAVFGWWLRRLVKRWDCSEKRTSHLELHLVRRDGYEPPDC